VTVACPVERLDRLAYESVDAVNWSTLRYALKSGLAYYYCLNANVPAETDAMRLGRMTHTAVFEPELLESEYAVWETRRAGGEWEQFKDAHRLQTIVRPEDAERALAIRDAVRSHPAARDLLASGEAECTITWTDPDTGVVCKGRMDWLTDCALVDLKTTRDIEIRAFGVHAAKMLYHCQLAFYQMGLLANGIERVAKIIAVESEPPHDVAVVDLNEDHLWAGEVKVREALGRVADCRKRKCWPGRYPQAVELMLPGYAFPTEDEEDAI
jgi:hypothetical protein